jgi:hypothetical protein
MPHLSTYIGLADHSEKTLAESFRAVAQGHGRAVDIFHMCHTLATMSDSHRDRLAPLLNHYGEQQSSEVREPERLHAEGLAGVRQGDIGLLRDLQDLHVLASLVQTTWIVLAQGAQGIRDRELLSVATDANTDTSRQLTWLNTRMKAVAPQALILGL